MIVVRVVAALVVVFATAVAARVFLDRVPSTPTRPLLLPKLGILLGALLVMVVATALLVGPPIRHATARGDLMLAMTYAFAGILVAGAAGLAFGPSIAELFGEAGAGSLLAIPREESLADVRTFERPRALARKGDHSEAVDAFREELGRHPNFAFAWRELADSLLRLHLHDEAIDALERGAQVETDPDQTATTALRAVDLCLDRGNMARAREILASLRARPWPPKLDAAIAAREKRLDA